MILVFPTVNAQIISHVAEMQGSIDKDTISVFVGKTKLSGSFRGYNISSFEDMQSLDDVTAFPLFGSTILKNIEKVTVIEISSLDLESLEDINLDNIIEFSNVEIIAENGPFILANNNGYINAEKDIDFAISSLITLDVDDTPNIPFLAVLANSKMDFSFQSRSESYFLQVSNESTVRIKDSNGGVLYQETSRNKVFIIDDENFSFTQDSPLYLFSQNSEEKIKLSISPAIPSKVDLNKILEDISNISGDFAGIPDFSEQFDMFNSAIDAISSIINGGLILVNTKDTVNIDGASQSFTNVGFARSKEFDVTLDPNSEQIEIDGKFKLIFLGDHFYTAQDPNSDTGVLFPFISIMVWIAALALFLSFKFYIKKDVNEELDSKIKKYAFIFHIVALIIAFILLDREISFQFGTSALDVLAGQGISIVLGLFLAVELVMWVLGYIALAFPVRMITNSTLRFFGIGKGGKAIGKGVGAFFIWVFCAIYVKVILNIIFLIINPSNLMPVG